MTRSPSAAQSDSIDLVDELPVAVIVTDASGLILRANRALTELSAWAEEDLLVPRK